MNIVKKFNWNLIFYLYGKIIIKLLHDIYDEVYTTKVTIFIYIHNEWLYYDVKSWYDINQYKKK